MSMKFGIIIIKQFRGFRYTNKPLYTNFEIQITAYINC